MCSIDCDKQQLWWPWNEEEWKWYLFINHPALLRTSVGNDGSEEGSWMVRDSWASVCPRRPPCPPQCETTQPWLNILEPTTVLLGKPVSYAERTQPDTCVGARAHTHTVSESAKHSGREFKLIRHLFFLNLSTCCSMDDLTWSANCCLFLILTFPKFIKLHIVSISHSCTD